MVVEVGYRPPPSAIPIGMMSGISIVGSLHTYFQNRPKPFFTGGALTGGLLMAYTSQHIRKHGATQNNLLGGIIGSGLMAMTACEAIIKTSSPVYKVILICSLGSMMYYTNEHIARYGPIRRGG